jgi:hypothetical protein
MYHLHTKPAVGGRPTIDTAPIAMAAHVCGMRPGDAAQLGERAQPGLVDDRAGREEQRDLDQRVVEHVHRGADERVRRRQPKPSTM